MPTVCTQFTHIYTDLQAQGLTCPLRSAVPHHGSVLFCLTLLAMLTVDRLTKLESFANEAMPTVLALYSLHKSSKGTGLELSTAYSSF